MEQRSSLLKSSTLLIKPTRGWKFVNVAEILEYRDLLFFLVVRGIKAKYAQSVLGIGWAVIQPLVSTLIFTIIFGSIAKVRSDGVPYFIFSLTGMVPWTYFSSTLSESASSLITNSHLITKVYFPRLVLPLAAAFSKILDFAITFVVLVISLVIYGFAFSWTLVLLPLLLIILLMTSLGIGLWLSAMAVQYRDVKHALAFVVQIMMYLAPVVYPTSNVPVRFQFWYSLDPMVGVIEGFRSIFLHHQPIPWDFILNGSVVSVVVFFSGVLYFRKMEKNFADVA